MDYDDVRFPPKISLNAVGGPRFKTSVVQMASGVEARRQWWERERGEWSVSHRARIPAEWEELLAFFRVIAQGMANTFRFKDWADYICQNGQGTFIDIEIGSPIRKQMVKRYSFGSYTYDRVIAKPIEGTIVTDAVGLDYSDGTATSGTTWYGQFDCWCRLNTDIAQMQWIDRKTERDDEGKPYLIIGWDNIEIVEVLYEQE